MMTRKLFIAGTVVSVAVGLCSLTGCSPVKNGNVELDSSKTVHPKTPAEIKAIQDNPHIPAGVKAQLLGQAGGPPMARKAAAGH